MQSLYDSLHVPNPQAPAASVDPWPEKMTGKEFAELVVGSVEFRQFILIGVSTGELPAAIVTRLMDYAWGKPVERLEVRDVTDPLEKLSTDDLKVQLEERVSYLRHVIDLLDESPEPPLSDHQPPTLVH